MTLDDELNRLLSYHISSPQFIYFEELFSKRLDSELYDSVINLDYYNSLKDKLKAYMNTFETYNEIGILDVLQASRKVANENYILQNCSAPMVKYIKSVSEDIYRIIDESKDLRFEANFRLSYLIDLLTLANSCIKDGDRKIYYYLNKVESCMVVTKRVHVISPELDTCYGIFFQLYRQALMDDKEFYEYVDNNKFKNLEKSSVFSSNSHLSYYDFLLLYVDFFESLILPTAQNDALTKDYVLNLILNSDATYKAKDSYSARINDLFDSIYYFKSSPYDGLSAYNSYGKDFIYYLDYESCRQTKDFCTLILKICEPLELIRFCVYRADNSYLENKNNLFCYNNTLYNTLLEYYNVGLLDEIDEVYNYFKRSE